MSGSRCPSEPRLVCPWLANLDAEIGIAKDDLEHRLFFGKKSLGQKIETLIQQRADVQAYIEADNCPGPEIRSSSIVSQSMYCGILVVNSALQKLDQELTQQVILEEE